MKKYIAPILLLLTFLRSAQSQSAEKLSQKSKDYERAGNIPQAILYAEKAANADKKNWVLSWQLGELILNKSERKGDALTPFTEAFNRGYQMPIVYHKQAMCYFHLGDHTNAVELLNLSIEENKRLLGKIENSGNHAEINHIRFQIADSYVWLTKQYEALEDPEQFYVASKYIEQYDPKNQWVNSVPRNGMNKLMFDKIAKGDYTTAIDLCKEEIEFTKRLGLQTDKEINRSTFLEILEKRARLGTITPRYIHKILAVYFNHFQTTYPWKGTHSTHDRLMTDREKRTALMDQKILTMVIEALSDGALSLSWDSVNINEPIRDVRLYEANDMVEPLWPANQEFTRLFKNRYQDFDTFFMIWNGPTKEAIGGAGSMLPGFPQRGTIRIHPDHGTSVWIHEFFHALEFKVGISPAHGFREEERKSLPEWKGETNNELDYYRWHFSNKIKAFGFENIKFR